MYKLKYQVPEIYYSGTTGKPKRPDVARTKQIYQETPMPTLK